jgi:hypothetical protein
MRLSADGESRSCNLAQAWNAIPRATYAFDKHQSGLLSCKDQNNPSVMLKEVIYIMMHRVPQ